jgi:hypothetical protein
MSREGIHPCPEKVKAVQNYPVPKSVKEVRSFLGLASYYRKLIPRFAEIAKPLTELTQKGEEFMWTPLRQKHFDELKKKLTTAPVLAYPEFQVPFILSTDASSKAIAAVLSQVQGGAERPTAYASRQLNKAERAYSA